MCFRRKNRLDKAATVICKSFFGVTMTGERTKKKSQQIQWRVWLKKPQKLVFDASTEWQKKKIALRNCKINQRGRKDATRKNVEQQRHCRHDCILVTRVDSFIRQSIDRSINVCRRSQKRYEKKRCARFALSRRTNLRADSLNSNVVFRIRHSTKWRRRIVSNVNACTHFVHDSSQNDTNRKTN